MLAHSIKERRVQISSYAGLLLMGGRQGGAAQAPPTPSWRKSLVLLGGRMSLTVLFLYVGVTQVSCHFYS